MSNILTHSMPAEEIACWITEIEREYPTLPRGEWRIAQEQLRQLRDGLCIRDESGRIEAEQRDVAEMATYAAMIERDRFELRF